METLAYRFAEKISTQMDYDKEKTAVIAYGLTAIIQMITIFSIISMFGILFDFWLECIIIYFGVGIIRKSTGGAHSETMKGCIIVSVLSIVGLSALSRHVFGMPINVGLNISITLLVFIVSFFVFYKRVPVDSTKKPIVKKEKIHRLRKQSFFILFVFLFATLIIILLADKMPRFYSLAACTRLVVIWIVFTLTKTGIRFFNFIDFKYMDKAT